MGIYVGVCPSQCERHSEKAKLVDIKIKEYKPFKTKHMFFLLIDSFTYFLIRQQNWSFTVIGLKGKKSRK